MQGALISGNYKLVVGLQEHQCDSLMWSPLDYPCNDGPKGPDCDKYCMFDVINDPNEHNDLSKDPKYTDVLEDLLKRYNKYGNEPRYMQDQGYHSENDLPMDKDACKYMADNGGYWRPWKD